MSLEASIENDRRNLFYLALLSLPYYIKYGVFIVILKVFMCLKSLGPIDRKFHGNGKNDGFVLYEYIIKQCSSFCKYTNISVMKKRSKKITCEQ